MADNINITNKKAGFEYELIDKFTAGIQLLGSEIKSIRAGKASIKESYCLFVKGELWVRNMDISVYAQASINNHEPKRERKLPLNRQELEKIHGKVKTKGMTIIPTRLFINDKGKAKIEIAVAKGKKHYDKRQTKKKRDWEKERARLFRKTS